MEGSANSRVGKSFVGEFVQHVAIMDLFAVKLLYVG